MTDEPPDIVLLGPEWRARTLLRAQLIEEGYEVVATDAWPIPRRYLRAGLTPRLVVIDLHGLDDPATVLDEVAAVLPPDRVLVITALGTLDAEPLRRRGFHVVARPATVGHVVARVTPLLRRTTPQGRT